MSDADGDSTMHSSPRSSVSDDLFPGADADVAAAAAAAAAASTNTAQNNDHSTNLLDGGGVPLPSTPAASTIKTVDLSPPNSQGAPVLGAPVDATTINANGKRVYYTANSGAALSLDGGKGKAPLDVNNGGASSSSAAAGELGDAAANGAKVVAPSVHAASGYRWEREADAPGWAWKNKKSQEDWYKAEESFVERDRMVKARYGDPLEGTRVEV
ncbi:hypothetical protein IWX90DRAFT_415426 [Phyllosticta citrichinensis]|uniref:Uncharacterized protein n=1 Tax=Phyllosticta citrichinensis TaxID=1130410 RepID=A0ABR1XV43_9PEZI